MKKGVEHGSWKGLIVDFMIEDDWEGDPSVPGGTRSFQTVPYLEVFSVDGSCITDYLTEDAFEEIEDYILQNY